MGYRQQAAIGLMKEKGMFNAKEIFKIIGDDKRAEDWLRVLELTKKIENVGIGMFRWKGD